MYYMFTNLQQQTGRLKVLKMLHEKLCMFTEFYVKTFWPKFKTFYWYIRINVSWYEDVANFAQQKVATSEVRNFVMCWYILAAK